MPTKLKKEPRRPTQEEIQDQIKRLRAIQPTVLRHSAFGDNHHDAIFAQIDVLEKRMSESSIFDNFPPEDEEDEDGQPGAQNVHDAAMDARRWLEGEWDAKFSGASDLVETWKELSHTTAKKGSKK